MTTDGLDEMGGGVKLLSLCSGYGGLDLAVESVFGAETVAFAEVDPHAAKVFARHWPGVPNLGDIAAADWTPWVGVDVVAAGFPCQDLSYAGKGAGIREGTRSGLWYAIEDALGVLRPRLVVLENVSAIVARRPGLDVVLAGLARLGFDAEWTCVRASDVGAPHRRERWFLVAADADGQGPQGQRRPSDPRQDDGHAGRGVRTAPAHPRGERHGRGQDAREVGRLDRGDAGAPRERERARAVVGDRGAAAPADPASIRRAERWTEADGRRVAAGGERALADTERSGRPGRSRAQGRSEGRGTAAGRAGEADRVQWGDYAPAIHRWEHILGRTAPAPTVLTVRKRSTKPVGMRGSLRGYDTRLGGYPIHRLSSRFVEWMMGLPAGWVTDTPGLSRAQQLTILGNGVVPQQAAAALRLLLGAWDRLLLDVREVAA